METPDSITLALYGSGRAASIFRDLEAFAADVELHPLSKLVADLPSLAVASQSKFGIALGAIRRRLEHDPFIDREQLRIAAYDTASTVEDTTVAERIRGIFTIEGADAGG